MTGGTIPAACRLISGVALVVIALVTVGCVTDSGHPVLRIGGIPDQNTSALREQFGLMAEYLAQETGIEVQYVPSNDYAAVVSAFQRGDIHLGWFGGLTGVQARNLVPDSHAIAQRVRDAEFHSVFVVRAGVTAKSLADLSGLSFTFGSESSTSGHLMPRHFLAQAGVDAEADFDGAPGFSGSHDKTYKLVEAGAYDAGALNEAVWEAAVRDGRVDTSKVRVLLRTPAYPDYNWSLRPDLDDEFGENTSARITRALLALAPAGGDLQAELLSVFGGGATGFVATSNENYGSIEAVARELGIIR